MSTELAYMMNYQEWKARAQKLEQTVKALQAELNVKDAEVAGLLAQVNALKAENPNSGLLKDTTEVYRTGKFAGQKKTKLRKVYENAYDAKAREKGISNPETLRAN